MISTLVLAAGKGERIGGPKALLLLGDEPLAIAHARRRLATESTSVILVVRRAIADALATFSVNGLVTVVSDEPDEHGPAGSIRAAIGSKALGAAAKVLVTPVDVPPADEPLTRALLEPLDTEDVKAVRPLRGHPVAVARDVLETNYPPPTRRLGPARVGRTSSTPPPAAPPLRAVLKALGRGLRTLERDGLPSIDAPEDAQRILGAPPRFWSPA